MRFILNPFSKRLDAFEADVGPAGDVETLTADTGGAIGPDGSGNINIYSGVGLTTAGAGTTITISQENLNLSQGSTVGAVTTDLFTLSLGATPTAYRFFIMITGFAAGGSSYGYTLDGTLETDGVTATVVQTVNRDADEDDTSAQASLIASGNNAVIRVLGVAGQTINWTARTQYINTL